MIGNRNVLVVDDSDLVRRIFFDALSLHGFTVSSACDGTSALKLLEDSDFGIIITDYCMPGMNGIELTKVLRFQYPDALIIGMSGDRLGDDFLTVGADVFLLKPVRLQDIISVIESFRGTEACNPCF